MMGWQDDTILSAATSAPDAVPALQPQKSNLWDSDPILASAEQLPEVGPRVAEGAIESIQSGYQASVGGLFWRGKLPELVMDPEHAKWWERALSGISQVGMDIPVMGLGGAFGGAAGTAAGTAILPGPGTAVGGILGAGAGMFGTPALMREILIAGYQSGEIKTAADFWNALRDMSGHVATETAKEAGIGAATFGAGGVAARTVGKAILPAVGEKITAATAIKTIGAADTAAQILTMTTAGKIAAMETMPSTFQEWFPDLKEIMDAAIVIGGLKLATPLAGRIARTFVKTGKTPAEQVADAKEHPEIAKEMRAEAEERQAREFSFKEQLTKQEELWSLQSRLVELERKASGTPETTIPGPEGKPVTRPAEPPAPLTDAERVERDALRIKVDAIEAETVKAEVPRETIPTGFSPEQLAEARDRAAARIAELTTREGTTPLTDAERVERIGLVNALSRPEELARRFEITPERRIPTAEESAASAQRVFDDVLRQLQEVDAARRAGGTEPLGDEHAQAVAALVRARVQARAERLGRLPEDIYTERPLKIRDQLQGGEELPGEPVPPDAPRFPSPEVDLFGNKLEPETPPQHAAKEYPVVKVQLADIKLSTDVPQFKAGANAKGVVEPLRGEIDLRGVPPVALWERLNGNLELISGRHRLDLWERKGMQTIDAQIFKESEGFDVRQASMLDAEMNIRDEHGRMSDYVNYFKNSGISEERAESRGLLGRAKGREGFRIAHDAVPELIAAHRAGLLSDDAALAISQTAPGSERLQVMGIAMVNDGKSILYATNMMRSLDLMAAERAAAGQQIDIFGFDDSAMIEAAALAKKASSAQRHIAEQISAVNGAAKRPELARKMGVNVEDPEGIKKRIAELRQEQYQWDNWPLYPELVARLRGEEGVQESRPAYTVDYEVRQDIGGFEPGKVETTTEQFDLFTPTKIQGSPIDGLEKIIVEPAQVGKHAVAFNRIRESGEAASVFQHLNDSPMEKFQVLGLDAKDKPIAFFTLFSGSLAQTSVYPREVWTSIYQTPGIKSVWIAHQHPSGIPEPSAADRMLTGELRKALTPDIGVTLRGHLIVTRKGTIDIGASGDIREAVEVKEGKAKKVIPIMERKIIRSDEEREIINSPSAVRGFFQKMAPKETGLLVLDTQHGVIGWWPMAEAEMARLRTGDVNTGMGALIQKVGRGNVSAAIAYSPGKATPEFARGVENIGTALAGADVRMLDAFTVEDGGRLASFAETGKPTTSSSGTFFQTAERPEFDLRAETPAEAAARDAEAAAAAKRKIAQEKEGAKGPAQTVDQTDMFAFQRTLFQGQEQAEPFYSQLRNSIQEAPDRMFSTGKATASWLEANSAKMGIKKGEIYWSGITDWMNAQGKVSKAEVLEYLDGNGVRIEEKMLGQQMYKSAGDRNFAVNTYREELHAKYGDGFMNEGKATAEERAELRRLEEGEAGDNSKFTSYQLPGGENYRELLLKLPTRRSLADKINEVADTDLAEAKRLLEIQSKTPDFRSTHFDQPNILAHIRMNDRTDASGKKVLFVEEVQSDWGQKGKREGFITEVTLPSGEKVKTLQNGAIPTAPFVTDTKAWTALALKRVISYAAENGYDRVAWTTGKQQADRYSLAKQIDSLMYAKRQDGTYQIKVVQKSGDAPTTMGSFAEKDLEGVVGKEIARKIIDGEGAQVPHSPLKHLENVDLKVGGEGMKGFYDQIVPQVVNSILKRVGGGKIENVEIGTEKYDSLKEETQRGKFVKDGKIVEQQPGFDITPEMRAKIKSEGMPLFQGKGQERDGEHLGSYTVAENLITTFKNANKSTIVHELGHSWLEEMKIDALRKDAPAQMKADWEIIRREFAIGEKGEISTASHEQFAKTFERYMAEGRAPSVGLRGVFERFKAWMLDVYKSLTNIGAEINPEARGVFDRMLATDREIADARELGVPRAYVDLARKTEAEKIVPPPEFRKIEPGAEAEQARQRHFADELPPGPGEAPDNIHVNYKYINSPMDVKLAMQRMSEIDQKNIQRQRGGKEGVKSWAEANAEQARYLNDILGGSEDTLRILSPRDPNAPGVDVRLGIIKKLMVGAAKDSARLRDVVLEAGHDATVRQQLEYMGSIERTRMIQAELLGERAAFGRGMNALKDITEGSGEISRMLDVIGYGEKAARELYQTKRSPAEEQAYLKAQLDAIMMNYRGKTVLDIARLHKEIGSLKGSYGFSKKVLEATKWEMLVEGWKSFLLSGPVTHTTNFFGTEAFHWLQPAVDVLAATIGMARGASPGMGETDRASMSEAIGRMSGMLAGVQDGLKVGMAAMKTGEGTGKTESYREAIPGRLGHIIRTPLRAMGAEDAMVTTMYERGELRTLAIRQAFNENLNPKTEAFAKRVQYLTDHPTPEIEARALATATRMTFNTPYGEKGLALANFINKWNLQWMIGFGRSGINIALEMLRLSPFAPGVEAWRADFAKGGAARDRALAEVTLGVGIASLTMAYAFSGSITGAGSPDPGKNRTKEGVWQPYSIFIDGKWYEYSRIQPVGTLMGMAADMANIWDHMTDEEKDKLPKMISTAFANAITNQTFLQGITNFVNALSDPTRFGPTFLERFAGTAVPNIIAQPAAMMDPHIREVNGMFEAIQARIPGWREGLLPSRDWLGEPRASKERVGVIMPVRKLEQSEDKVRIEAARLNLSMAAPPRKTHIGKGTGKIGDVPLTPEERDIFAKVGGEMTHNILTNIVNAPGYDEMPDMVKRKIFAQVVSASHRVAAVAALPPEKRTDYLQQITERMQAELAPGEP